jgi:hypothetical protein
VSPKPQEVTTDLGLGVPLTNPDAPTIWTYRIHHATRGQVRAGRSVCATYTNGDDAARGILRDYLKAAQVPQANRKEYSASTERFGFSACLRTPDSHGGALGKEIR